MFLIGWKHTTLKSLLIGINTLNGDSSFKSIPIGYAIYDIEFIDSSNSLIASGGYLSKPYLAKISFDMNLL